MNLYIFQKFNYYKLNIFQHGGKNMILFALTMSSVGTLLVPLCAKASYYALLVCRFFTGLGQVFFFE